LLNDQNKSPLKSKAESAIAGNICAMKKQSKNNDYGQLFFLEKSIVSTGTKQGKCSFDHSVGN